MNAAIISVPNEVAEAITMVQSDSPHVTIEGLSKLSHATFNNPMTKEIAGAAGAIKAIAHAMERNVFDGNLQKDACHALRNITFHCQPNLVLAREQGALSAVFKAMESHPQNEALQAEGCWALLIFCSNMEENIIVARPHESIVHNALATHPTNPDIQSRGRFLTALLA
ncbi:putative armadillo repeat-containing protein [Plasmopara halstedii]